MYLDYDNLYPSISKTGKVLNYGVLFISSHLFLNSIEKKGDQLLLLPSQYLSMIIAIELVFPERKG